LALLILLPNLDASYAPPGEVFCFQISIKFDLICNTKHLQILIWSPVHLGVIPHLLSTKETVVWLQVLSMLRTCCLQSSC